MNEEEYYKRIYFLAAVLGAFLVFVAYINIRGANVPDQPVGAEHVEQQLNTTSNYQQSAITDIERAERYAQSSEVRLDGAARSVEELQVGADESAKLIAECQQIIRTVQARGATTQSKN